jgi:hypothetical protein
MSSRPDPTPTNPFPEIQELVRTARAYVAGEVHFSYVCGAAWALADAARIYSADPKIRKLAEEWSTMATRAWPEMAQVEKVTEDEFRHWVQAQLTVFEPWT